MRIETIKEVVHIRLWNLIDTPCNVVIIVFGPNRGTVKLRRH